MISLKLLQENAFSDFLAFSIEEYAKEMASNFDLPLEKAREVATMQATGRLAEGVNTPGNFFYHIERQESNGRELIGYLWYSINPNEGYAYLESIDLFTPFQNQGVGGEVLRLMEEQLATQDIRSMSLHVAGTNQRALRFYQRHGYKITGYNMKKNW
ncbi:MAG: GNAT family N-acetyltransferase [Caldilineaceae bacterium]